MAKEVSGDIYNPDAWAGIDAIEKGIGQLLKFTEHGEVLIGLYQGQVTLDTDDGEAHYLQFAESMFQGEKVGLIAVSASFDLTQKLADVAEGSPVFIRYVKDQDTSRGQTPMKVYEVKAKF